MMILVAFGLLGENVVKEVKTEFERENVWTIYTASYLLNRFQQMAIQPSV